MKINNTQSQATIITFYGNLFKINAAFINNSKSDIALELYDKYINYSNNFTYFSIKSMY